MTVFAALALECTDSNSLVGCESRFSGLEYPAAARVCDVTPCKPVNPVRVFFGLFVMKRCKCVPCHGSSCLSSSKSLISLSSSRPFARFGPLMLSTAAFIFSSLASASFFLRVSSRIVVAESMGREMLLMVDAFRSLAAFRRRIYSAWWRCFVNVWATAWNSSSTMMYISSAERPGRMNASVGGCGGGEVEGVRADTVVSRCSYGGPNGYYLLCVRFASWDLLPHEGGHYRQSLTLDPAFAAVSQGLDEQTGGWSPFHPVARVASWPWLWIL